MTTKFAVGGTEIIDNAGLVPWARLVSVPSQVYSANVQLLQMGSMGVSGLQWTWSQSGTTRYINTTAGNCGNCNCNC